MTAKKIFKLLNPISIILHLHQRVLHIFSSLKMSYASSSTSYHSYNFSYQLSWFKGVKFDYKGPERRCECRPRSSKASMRISWTRSNPGRRFFNWPKVRCQFMFMIIVYDIMIINWDGNIENFRVNVDFLSGNMRNLQVGLLK